MRQAPELPSLHDLAAVLPPVVAEAAVAAVEVAMAAIVATMEVTEATVGVTVVTVAVTVATLAVTVATEAVSVAEAVLAPRVIERCAFAARIPSSVCSWTSFWHILHVFSLEREKIQTWY